MSLKYVNSRSEFVNILPFGRLLFYVNNLDGCRCKRGFSLCVSALWCSVAPAAEPDGRPPPPSRTWSCSAAAAARPGGRQRMRATDGTVEMGIIKNKLRKNDQHWHLGTEASLVDEKGLFILPQHLVDRLSAWGGSLDALHSAAPSNYGLRGVSEQTQWG